MRVAHIIKATRIAGAERHLLILLKALQQRDYQAHLLLLVEPDKPMQDLIAQAEALGISTHSLVIRLDFDAPLILRITRYLRDIRPDLVHTHLIHADLHGTLAARWAGLPVISTRHNDNAFRRRLPYRLINRLLWWLSAGGIVISEALLDFTVRVEGAPRHKLHVVRYGMAHQPLSAQTIQSARAALRGSLSQGPEAVLLGMVCRLVEQKGVTYALQAFQQVAQAHPEAHLLIAGDGPLQAELEAQAQALGISHRVHFLGWRADVDAIMAGLDVFVLSSLWEGFGLVLLEAMAARLPIIASRVSAIPEIVIDGESGLLVPPAQPDQLAAAMDTLLSDRLLGRHMGLVGEDRLDTHFAAARMADETDAVYRQLSLPIDKANAG